MGIEASHNSLFMDDNSHLFHNLLLEYYTV